MGLVLEMKYQAHGGAAEQPGDLLANLRYSKKSKDGFF